MPDTPEYIDLTPTWTAVLTYIVPIGFDNGDAESRRLALDTLRDAARKLDMLQRFIDSDDRVLRMLQDFQQQEAAR